MTIRPHKARQTELGYTPAEERGAEAFEVYGDPTNQEAAVFTGTRRNRPVGFLNHDPVKHKVDSVYVSPQFRGKGLGPVMYQAAGEPAHSSRLTEQGEHFANKVGGKMPNKQNIQRQEPLDTDIYEDMLPDFANWIRASGQRVQ